MTSDHASRPAGSASLTALVVAGICSLGAGAIHAAAIGAHSEHREVVVTFTVIAAFQLAWGAAATSWRAPKAWFLGVGLLGNGAAVVGWLLAKTTGIGFIRGLETAESLQLADTAAAVLALGSGVLAARVLLARDAVSPAAHTRFRPGVGLVVLPVAILTIASMISVGSHSHAEGHSHDEEVALGHDHVTEDGTSAAAFDADDRVDLSGVPGVTAEEQAEAEDLVERTMDRLPRFADVASLNDKGFFSIGDALTGYEHYINWSYVNDDRRLDPDHPESLVIRHEQGAQTLVAAMYMLEEGTTFDDVPDIGGPLVQWHVHGDLCLTDDPVAPRLAFDLRVRVTGECTPPNTKRGNVPMVHVWIVPHPCGPFAALDGIGGGQVAPGETAVCTKVHSHVGG